MTFPRNSAFSSLALNRRRFLRYGSLAVGTSILAACTSGTHNADTASSSSATSTVSSGAALDTVTFGTSWFAQAEHGGFYQAVATGIYEEHGLDVTIRMGRPQVNGKQVLMAGTTDFKMGYAIDAINAIYSCSQLD